jgi:hypothetical protein
VHAGGYSGLIGDQARTALPAIDSNGVVTAWNAAFGPTSVLFARTLYGATLYAGGGFSSIRGRSRDHIAALDAITGAPLPWNPSLPGGAHAMAVHQRWIYATGNFLDRLHRSFAVFSGSGTMLAVDRTEPTAAGLRAAPHPFRSEVALRFALPRAGDLDVTFHDVAGRLVRRLAHGPRGGGEQRVARDGG